MTPSKGATVVNFSLKRSAAAVTALLIAVMTGGLATAVPAVASAPIAITGIDGGTVTPDGTTGYTLTIPGLTPSTSYQAVVDAQDTMWAYGATATSNGAGLGTFAITFPAPKDPGTTIYVSAYPLSTATNFSDVSVSFGDTADTTPVPVIGEGGVTIAGDGTSGYLLAVPGLTPNTTYTVYDGGGMSSFPITTASSNGAGLVTFAFASTPSGAEPGATLSLSSSSAPVGSSADGTFVVPDTAAVPVVVVNPADDTSTVVAGEQVTVNAESNDVATTDGAAIPAADLTYATLTVPTHGTVTWNANHSLVYTATTAGVDAFTYRVTDATSGVYGDATVTVTVAAAPVAPTAAITAANDTATTAADGAVPAVPVNIPVAANDTVTMSDGSAVDATAVTYTTVDPPTLGTTTWNSDHSLTYTAGAVEGVDTFTYRVSYLGVSADATVTVTVDPAGVIVSDPTTVTAVDDTATVVASSGATTIDVAANDSAEAMGFPVPTTDLPYTLLTQPTLGTATFNSTHGIVYTPGSVAGVDTFTYRVVGTDANSDATVTVTVTAAPDPVVVVTAVDDTAAALTRGPAIVIDVAANDTATLAGSPVPTAGLTYTVLTNPTLGTAVFDSTLRAVVYTPCPAMSSCGGGFGVDAFTYRVSYLGVSADAMVFVTVTEPPVPVVVITAVNDTAVSVVGINAVSVNPPGIDVGANDSVTVNGVPASPTLLTYTLTEAGAATGASMGTDGSLAYTINSNPIEYTACYMGACSTATATFITVSYDPVEVLMGYSASALVRPLQPADPGSLTYSVLTQPVSGTVRVDQGNAGAFIYSADAQTGPDHPDTDSFAVQACEPVSGACGTGALAVYLYGAYQTVAVNDDTVVVAAGHTVALDVKANDTMVNWIRQEDLTGVAPYSTREPLANAIDANPPWQVGKAAGTICEGTGGKPVWLAGATFNVLAPPPACGDIHQTLGIIPGDLTYKFDTLPTLGTIAWDPTSPGQAIYIAGPAAGVDSFSYKVCSAKFGVCSFAAGTTVTVTAAAFTTDIPLPKTSGDDQLLLLGGIGGLAAILAGAFLFGGRRRRADED